MRLEVAAGRQPAAASSPPPPPPPPLHPREESPCAGTPAPDRPIEEVLDHSIDARLKAENLTPAPQADDANLIRRLTLDLVGRIPTVPEVKAFVESKEPDRRAKLVDRLMASPGFVRHQA